MKTKTNTDKVAAATNNYAAERDAENKKWHLDNAVKDLRKAATRARELAEVLERHATEMETPPASGIKITPVDRYTWAINEIENYIRNINFSNLARNTARLN